MIFACCQKNVDQETADGVLEELSILSHNHKASHLGLGFYLVICHQGCEGIAYDQIFKETWEPSARFSNVS